MKLSFILEQARSGELDALSTKDKTDKKIINYLNLALIALYNRFVLSTEEAIIELDTITPRTLYRLDGTDPNVTVNGMPMEPDDFKAIIGAFNEDGSVINVNDEHDPYSIFTVAYNQVQVPLLANNSYISIIYSRNPKLVSYIKTPCGETADVDVELPMQLLEAALHYIGYRAHGAVNGEINAENSTHYTRFLRACEEAERLGVVTADDTEGLPVEVKGFV